jgi:hypothetical protein
MKKFFSLLVLLIFITQAKYFAQGSINLNGLPPFEEAKYLQPLSTYLGTYFNTGTSYDAHIPETFGFKFSIIGMWSLVPDDQKTFTPNPQIEGVENLSPTATVFGNQPTYFLSSKGFFVYPSGASLKGIPLGIYQAAASLYGTELMIRFFPNSKFDDAKVGLFGFGLKHNINRYLPLLPVDVAVQILYNKFDAEYSGNEIDKYAKVSSKNFAFNVQASKSFIGLFTVYSGIQYESSSTDFGYFFNDEKNLYPEYSNKRLDISVDGENHFRYTLGGAFRLGFFVLNADVNVTKFTTFSTGISFDF